MSDVNVNPGQVSDGYHTFDELYDHRITLWIALCRKMAQFHHRSDDLVWRTELHSDGTSIDGWFLLGLTMENGQQMTYHLPMDRWRECEFARTLDRAPEFDGHTSADVLERIGRL